MARIPAFQAGGPGSIPGRRIFFTIIFFFKFFEKNLHCKILVDKTFPVSCGTHGLVGYDVRLTRGRSPVQFRVGVLFYFQFFVFGFCFSKKEKKTFYTAQQ